MPDITLVIVNYLSAELARSAISSARTTTRSRLRVVVVDNSGDRSESRFLESAGADDVIVPPGNLGYSGGGNLGVAAATTPIVVVSNPDVLFGESCLDRLAESVRDGFAVAGPLFHWDSAGHWMLPPAEVLGVGEKLSQVLAGRFPAAARRRDRKRASRRLEFWRRRDPGPIAAVSGAVMAIDREKFDAVSGFDSAYELYFEEIDLVRRLHSRGWKTVYVPDARCRHLYNQSAALDPGSEAKFRRSEATYLRRWARIALPLAPLVRVVRPDGSRFEAIEPSAPIVLPSPEREWLVEATPLPSFDSAVGCFTSAESVTLPEEIWATYRSSSLCLRVVDPATLEVARKYVMRK